MINFSIMVPCIKHGAKHTPPLPYIPNNLNTNNVNTAFFSAEEDRTTVKNLPRTPTANTFVRGSAARLSGAHNPQARAGCCSTLKQESGPPSEHPRPGQVTNGRVCTELPTLLVPFSCLGKLQTVTHPLLMSDERRYRTGVSDSVSVSGDFKG